MKKTLLSLVLTLGLLTVSFAQQTDDILFADNSNQRTSTYNSPDHYRNPVSHKPVSKTMNARAQFPGGLSALATYLSNEITYPEAAREQGDEGRVMVEFVVNPSGAITNINLMNYLSPELDAEALRIVKEMPQWQPAYSNGEAVKSKVVVPIRFSLR